MASDEKIPATILAIINRKGGVGKTTTAVSLAHGLSLKLIRRVKARDLGRVPDPGQLFRHSGRYYYSEGHVLLIDFDAQGHCARALGVDPGQSDVGDVLLGRQNLNQAVLSADRAADGYPRPNLWVLPSSDKLEMAKESLYSQSLEYAIAGYGSKVQWLLALLQRRFNLARERFAYIILDNAPGLDLLAQAVYQFADAAIVPVKPDYLSMAGTGQNLDYIRDMQERGGTTVVHSIVPTFCMERQRLDREMMASLHEKYGQLVSEAIPRSQIVAEAPAYQLTVFEIDPHQRNPATVAYQNLVNRVYDG
jgi:chromosome partitioning protein